MKNTLSIILLLCCGFLGCDDSGNQNTAGSTNRGQESELFALVKSGSLADLKAALNNKADPNVRDELGMTPLMISAKLNKGDFFSELIRFGAKVDMRDNAGQTALDMVISPMPIDQIGQKITALDKIANKTEQQKTELESLTQLSLIKRYGKIANYEVPKEFVIVPNPGGGSCFFWSIAPFLKEIFPGQYNGFAQQNDVRQFLTTYFNTIAGQNFAAKKLPILRVSDPTHYDRKDQKNGQLMDVKDKDDLVALITNTGKFAGETFWGDDFTDGLVKKIADIIIIKMVERKFGNGRDIFYCQGDVDKKHIAFMKYHPDAHYEAIKLVETGKADKYIFDYTNPNNIPKAALEMIDNYKLQCKQ